MLIAVAASTVGLVVSGAIRLPDAEAAILGIGPALGQWTYLLVAALAFLETGTFLGLVMPGEAIIVLGGFVAGQGVIELAVLIPLVWVAAVAGDSAGYWLGRRLGRGFLLRHGPRFAVTAPLLASAERYFARYGGATILVGRFFGIIRALAPFLAGASRMPFRRFLVFDALGAGLWAATFAILGWVFWQSIDSALRHAGQGKLLLAALVALAVAFLAGKRVLARRARRRQPLEPSASVPQIASVELPVGHPGREA